MELQKNWEVTELDGQDEKIWEEFKKCRCNFLNEMKKIGISIWGNKCCLPYKNSFFYRIVLFKSEDKIIGYILLTKLFKERAYINELWVEKNSRGKNGVNNKITVVEEMMKYINNIYKEYWLNVNKKNENALKNYKKNYNCLCCDNHKKDKKEGLKMYNRVIYIKNLPFFICLLLVDLYLFFFISPSLSFLNIIILNIIAIVLYFGFINCYSKWEFRKNGKEILFSGPKKEDTK